MNIIVNDFIIKKWTRRDLNPNSPPCKGGALPDSATSPSNKIQCFKQLNTVNSQPLIIKEV